MLQFGASAQDETITFRSFYDSLSFALGAENGLQLFQGGRNMEMLDKFALVRGFQSNLFGDPVESTCRETLEQFLGETGTEFNTNYLKAGSTCLGSFMSFEFYNQMKELQYLEDLNMSLVLKGFKKGTFNEYEKYLSLKQIAALLDRFLEIVQGDKITEISRNDALFWKWFYRIRLFSR
ncbi:MAG: hypothetical protein AB8B56_09490 [Crocinitomicaceae bacterium]